MSNESPVKIKYKFQSTKDNKIVALMCPYCYNLVGSIGQNLKVDLFTLEDGKEKIYNHTIKYDVEGECEYCEEYVHQFIEIDGDLAAAISNLNQKGWKTNFCCAGHPTSPSAYIAFKNNRYLKYISILPRGWKIDLEDYSKKKEFIIRSKFSDYTPIEVYEWSKRLPILPDTSKIKTIPDKELIEKLLNLKEY